LSLLRSWLRHHRRITRENVPLYLSFLGWSGTLALNGKGSPGVPSSPDSLAVRNLD
jgi:hypothetical protein